MSREIKFRAILAPVMAAIRIGGDSCRIQIDVPKSDMANVIGLAALTDLELEFTVRVAGKEKAAEKVSRLYGAYWQAWFKPNANGASLINSTLLVDSLALDDGPITPEGVKLALRAALGVDSLSRYASPEVFESYLQAHQLEGLVTQSRRIVARLEEQENG